MPAPIVALLLAVGFSAWVYSKIMRTTGGNTQNSLVVAAIAGVFGFVILWVVLKFIESSLQ